MSASMLGDSDLDPPEWIQCDECAKWRKLPAEYILGVRDGPWNCSERGSGCSCAEACHSCSGANCTCTSSGFWQDTANPEKCTFAFGANIPKGFTHFVKQKPAGQLYVEYSVDCLWCDAHATLDRRYESPKAKERLQFCGKGDARTVECWLRDHQGCNADWNRLTPISFDFTVPLGFRRFSNTKSPLYTPLPPATSASSQPATSDLSTAVTSSAQSSACLTYPAQTSGSDVFPTNGLQPAQDAPPQHSTMDQVPAPASLVLKEEADSEQLPPAADSVVGNAAVALARPDKAIAGSSSASAAEGLPAGLPEGRYLATPDVKETKPAVQSASVSISRPCQDQASLQCKILHPPFSQTSAQLRARACGNTDSFATCVTSNQHVHRPAGATVTTPEQIVTPSDSGEAVHRSATALDVPARSLPLQCVTAKRALPRDLPTPRGLNGMLLSRSQKRKATSMRVPSPDPQIATVDLTMSDDDSAEKVLGNTKRVKAEAAEHAPGHADSAGSLALMVQKVNRSLAEKPITMEQLQRLQDAIDGVSELKALQPQELTHVLTSIGGLEVVQKIFVREYLNSV